MIKTSVVSSSFWKTESGPSLSVVTTSSCPCSLSQDSIPSWERERGRWEEEKKGGDGRRRCSRGNGGDEIPAVEVIVVANEMKAYLVLSRSQQSRLLLSGLSSRVQDGKNLGGKEGKKAKTTERRQFRCELERRRRDGRDRDSLS